MWWLTSHFHENKNSNGNNNVFFAETAPLLVYTNSEDENRRLTLWMRNVWKNGVWH